MNDLPASMPVRSARLRRRTTRPITIAVASLAALGATSGLAPAGALVAAAPAGVAVAGHRHAAEPVALPAGFRPEGITSGPGDTYYVGSLADGRIRTGDLSRGTGRDLVAGVTGRALRGLQYDRRSGLLWAVGQDATTGIVLVVEARTGRVKERITVPGAVFLNDLVITRDAVWVTDSRLDVLTRIPVDRRGRPAGALSSLPLTGPWPTPVGNRANGIRQLPDGSLLVVNSTAAALFRVDPETGAVSPIPVEDGPGLTGGDGLELDGHTLYVVRGSGQYEVSVLRLERTGSGWTARWKAALTSPALDIPSTATLVGRTLWTVNARFGVADPATASYSITPLRTR